MKGTISDLVGQGSGLLIIGNYGVLGNWEGDLSEYKRVGRPRRIANVLSWLVRNGWIKYLSDGEVMMMYARDCQPVALEEFEYPGKLWTLLSEDGREILVVTVDGWY